jgi:hypothetical protein
MDSKELKAFKDNFETSTGLKVDHSYEDTTTPHWKRLLFRSLNAEKMLKISEYLLMNFSTPGRFSHLLPSIHTFQGYVALTIDENMIKEFIIDRK